MAEHKLEAIEIYQKILEVVKGQDFADVNTALDFARNKISNDHYKTQEAAQKAVYARNALVGSSGLAAYDPQAEAVAIVRNIVREELRATEGESEKKEAA